MYIFNECRKKYSPKMFEHVRNDSKLSDSSCVKWVEEVLMGEVGPLRPILRGSWNLSIGAILSEFQPCLVFYIHSPVDRLLESLKTGKKRLFRFCVS